MARNLIVVSGYYGFDNLGDEAILEELLSELSQLVKREDIVVLSNDPQVTTARYNVQAADRWQLGGIVPLLGRARLFISGGGGLFQDTASSGSVIYYGGLICLAKALGAKTMVYAQGIGPLHRPVSQFITKAVFNIADQISLRDEKSMAMLQSWGQTGNLTEDPVWLLKQGKLPAAVEAALRDLKTSSGLVVGLSLRQGGGFTTGQIRALASAMHASLPANAAVVALPLQKELDEPALAVFAQEFKSLGRAFHNLDLSELVLPSQWLTLIGRLNLVVGMRLHSLIMALSAGVPVVGIAYDPKVGRILEQFEQPALGYTRDSETISDETGKEWTAILQGAVKDMKSLAKRAAGEAAICRQMSCQNAEIIAKILN